jgi:hypothetical protein
VRHALKEAKLQNPVLTNRNGIRGHNVWGKQPCSCNAQRVEKKGRYGRFRSDWRKGRAITGGGLARHELSGEKSAEVIVAVATSFPGERKVIREEVSQGVKG